MHQLKRIFIHGFISLFLLHMIVVFFLLGNGMKTMVPPALIYWHLLMAVLILPASALFEFTRIKLAKKFTMTGTLLLTFIITLTPQTLGMAIYLRQFFYPHFLNAPQNDFLTSEHAWWIALLSLVVSVTFIIVDRFIFWRWEIKKGS